MVEVSAGPAAMTEVAVVAGDAATGVAVPDKAGTGGLVEPEGASDTDSTGAWRVYDQRLRWHG